MFQSLTSNKRARKTAMNASFTELSNCISFSDQTIWDDTTKMWEFYWKTDGPNNVHRHFSCKEMYERNEKYFKNAAEPIMFKRMGDRQWLSSDQCDLVKELRKCNRTHRRS
eukprot:147706_1